MLRKLSTIAAICYLLPLSAHANTQEFAVGSYESPASREHFPIITDFPLIALADSAENIWTYHPLSDLPNDYRGGYLSNVSCNEKTCITVGNYISPTGPYPFLATSFNQGNQWNYNAAFKDKNAGSELNSGTCNNNLCIVVGEDRQKNSDNSLPLLSVGDGNQWNSPISVISNLPSNFVDGEFGDVVCHHSFCIAAGEYYSTSHIKIPLVAISSDKNKENWNYSPIPHPKDMVYTYVSDLYCNDKVCIISGVYESSENKQLPLLITSYDQGKTWNYPTNKSSIRKTTCHQDLCIGIGDSPLIVVSHDAGKTWESKQIPTSIKNVGLSDVSCNQKICIASGWSNSEQLPLTMLSKDQGETWSTSQPIPKDVGRWSYIEGVKCNDTSCFVTGSYQTNTGKGLPLLATTVDGNTWSFPASVIDNLPQDFISGGFNSASQADGLNMKKRRV
jgi:hypothetical protein